MNNNIVINKVNIVLYNLKKCIKQDLPFGLVRFGDGTIKAIHAFTTEDEKQLSSIAKQEGIPPLIFGKIIKLWKTSANICDYIDSPEVYFNNKFWMRTKKFNKEKMSQKTIMRLKMWLDLYKSIGIINENYCNPEINFLSCIGKVTLPDLLQKKKVCCITSREDVKEKLSEFFDIDVITINGKNENHFLSFPKVVDYIDTNKIKYDLWLIAAGELGRVYPGLIKFKGERAFDIGSLIDVWCGDEIPSRLQAYITRTDEHPLKLKLTPEGKLYSIHI